MNFEEIFLNLFNSFRRLNIEPRLKKKLFKAFNELISKIERFLKLLQKYLAPDYILINNQPSPITREIKEIFEGFLKNIKQEVKMLENDLKDATF